MTGRVDLPADAERNEEDRKPLQAGLFRSKDGVTWEIPSIAPWTWQQADVEGEVAPFRAARVRRGGHGEARDDDGDGKDAGACAQVGPPTGGGSEVQ